MSRRKFNLGDILRKISEESSKEGGQPQSNQSSKKSERVPYPPHVQSTTEAGRPDGDCRQSPPDKFPRQPSYAPSKPPHYKPVVESGETLSNEGIDLHKDDINKKTDATDSQQGKAASAPHYVPAPPPLRYHSSEKFSVSSSDDEDDEESFDIYKYLGILNRRKYSIALIVLITVLFSLFRYLKSEKYYIAQARLLFRPDNQGIINDQMNFRYWGEREKIFNTHLELLRSHTVLTMVSENLGGTETPEAIGSYITIKQGETNGEKNDIIELSCRHRNAETARDMVNELCRSYIDYRRNVNSQEITRLIGKFEFQIDKIQTELSAKESALREFKESHRMVELSNETNATIAKLADMETALQQTELSLLETRERLSALNDQIGSQQLDIVQSVTYQDPFQNRIAALELELNTLSSEYSPEHFKVKTLRQQIDNLKAATADSITREATSKTLVKNPIRQAMLQELINLSIEKSALEAKRVAQEGIIDRLNGELTRLPAMEQKFAYLQRETESLVQTLRMLKGKYEETKIRRDSEESDLKILELAQTPRNALTKVSFSNIIIGIIVGIVLGIGLAFLLEYLDQTIKEPASIEKNLGIPLLSFVPIIEADKVLTESSNDLTKNILEPFRALRANLKHLAEKHSTRTFLICSAVKGEGKTTLAANLAITFAIDGKKVILVDGDLRRPQLHSIFAIPRQDGLVDYLNGTLSADQILKSTSFENMRVITSGERPHNPAELLGTFRFQRLIDELKEKADIIIFDSPALLPVSDTITMAPKMEGILFVVRTLWTPMKAAIHALNQLRRIGVHIYGGILNGVSHSGKYYPYYYGYYGYYSYKYSYDEDRKRPFSIRESGLRIERSIKNGLTSARYAIPKLASDFNRGAKTLATRKMLWVLLICLLTITGIRLALEASRPTIPTESIIYMGLGGNDMESQSHSDMYNRVEKSDSTMLNRKAQVKEGR